jgi:ATP-dependent helicase/nuclease subunit B
MAPDRPLDPQVERQDEAALAQLLEALDSSLDLVDGRASGRLVSDLTDFAGGLRRLMAQKVVWPHRQPFLPVQVTGLIEARLEAFDLLVLAGLTEEVFPGAARRSVFLSDRSRLQLGLPTWRDRLAEQGDLFLRLLHNAKEVVLTWAGERQGQPCLPSPFVVRLGLSGHLGCTRYPTPPLYRREAPPTNQILTGQKSFTGEVVQIPVQAKTRPLHQFSHSRLRTYLDCPYQFLLEDGYALREEEVLEAFRRQDYGTLVHRCLQEFLVPEGDGFAALVAGRPAEACEILRQIAGQKFGEGAAEMPQRRLWEATFLKGAPALVGFELERFQAGWRPLCLEQGFRFSYLGLQEWLQAEGEAPAGEPDLPEPPAGLGVLTLVGKIDRIDGRKEGSQLAVIDYKTGKIPTAKEVSEGRDLQIVLYALALATGSLPGWSLPTDWQISQGAYYRVTPAECGFPRESPHLLTEGLAGRQILRRGAVAILKAAAAAYDRNRPFPLVPAHWEGQQPGGLPCRYCPYPAICRLEERSTPLHLGVRVTKELTGIRRD